MPVAVQLTNQQLFCNCCRTQTLFCLALTLIKPKLLDLKQDCGTWHRKMN